MPQNKNSSKPPKVMTWTKASPVLALSIIFYVLQQMFELFIVFGPILIAVGCTAGVNSVANTSLDTIGGKAGATVCTGIAALAGVFGAAGFEGFGLIMAEIVGLIGWGVVMFVILITNRRVFKEEASLFFSFFINFIVSEVPLLEIVPGLPIFTFRLYHKQIKREKAALRAYQKQKAEEARQEREARHAELAQAQIAQIESQEAANEAQYEESLTAEAANDSEYIPEETGRAA